MARSNAATPEAYIAGLPPERREAISGIRQVILDNLPQGYEEGMQHGMIGYYIPLEDYPDTYNHQPLGVAALASQKNYMSLYLLGVYGDPQTKDWFEERWQATGKKLRMGRSCVRFGKLEDVPLGVVGEVISRIPPERFIAQYEASRQP